MPIPVASITESYAALTVLTQAQLNQAIGDNASGSVEYYLNTNVRNNFIQLALDTFGPTYDFTNDGIPAFGTPLIDQAALLAGNETITGNWTFTGTVAHSAAVTSTSTFTSSGQQKCRAYLTTAAQNITNATLTAISLQAESYDTGSMHDNATLPSRIIIPAGGNGTYSLLGQVEFAANATGYRTVYIYKNGSEVASVRELSPSGTITTKLQVSFQDTAVAGDYYELYVYQNSGGGLDVNFGANITFFSIIRNW